GQDAPLHARDAVLLERAREAALHEPVDEREPVGECPRRHVLTLTRPHSRVDPHPPLSNLHESSAPTRVLSASDARCTPTSPAFSTFGAGADGEPGGADGEPGRGRMPGRAGRGGATRRTPARAPSRSTAARSRR